MRISRTTTRFDEQGLLYRVNLDLGTRHYARKLCSSRCHGTVVDDRSWVRCTGPHPELADRPSLSSLFLSHHCA